MLSDGEMDLVIANWDEPPAHLHMSKLFEDPIICTMRADSPYAKRTGADDLTLDDYPTLPAVAPSPQGTGIGVGQVLGLFDRHHAVVVDRGQRVIATCHPMQGERA